MAKLNVNLKNVGTLAEDGSNNNSRKWGFCFTKSELMLGFGVD